MLPLDTFDVMIYLISMRKRIVEKEKFRLVFAREAKKFPSQRVLAILLGIDKAQVSNYATGKLCPSRLYWTKIKEIMGIDCEKYAK
jgi:hypothetical protein